MRSRVIRLVAVAALLLSSGGLDAATRPRYGGQLVRGHLGQISTLNPTEAATAIEREVARQLHAGLYRFDAEGEPIADLVSKAEVIDSGNAVRLELREVVFHDGRPLTGSDVVASINRYIDGDRCGGLLRSTDARIPAAVVTGERTIVLRVDGAPVLWPWLLADVGASILPIDGDGSVGAGPFALTSAERTDRLRLEAWIRHHRGRPLFDTVEYRALPNERALGLAQRHQGVHVIDRVGPGEKEGTGFGTRTETVAILLNGGRKVLASRPVRGIILGALRRDALVDVVLRGRGTRAVTFLSLQPVIAPPEADPLPDDGEEVEGAHAGSTPEALSLHYPSAAGLRGIAERIQIDLHRAGIDVTPAALPAVELGGRVTRRDYDLALVVVSGAEMPPVCELAEATAILGRPPTAALQRAAGKVEPFGSGGLDLFHAERSLFESLEFSVLFRRERAYFRSSGVRDLILSPDGTIILESSWRRPSP